MPEVKISNIDDIQKNQTLNFIQTLLFECYFSLGADRGKFAYVAHDIVSLNITITRFQCDKRRITKRCIQQCKKRVSLKRLTLPL